MACAGVPLTLGARAGAWPPRAYSGVWGGGFKSLAGGSSACCEWVLAVPRSDCGGEWPDWPTPVHEPGERERHDCCEVDRELLHKRVQSGPKRGAAAFVLPKGVWTMSALTSALLAAAEGVSGLDLAVPRDRREEEGRTGSRRSDASLASGWGNPTDGRRGRSIN